MWEKKTKPILLTIINCLSMRAWGTVSKQTHYLQVLFILFFKLYCIDCSFTIVSISEMQKSLVSVHIYLQAIYKSTFKLIYLCFRLIYFLYKNLACRCLILANLNSGISRIKHFLVESIANSLSYSCDIVFLRNVLIRLRVEIGETSLRLGSCHWRCDQDTQEFHCFCEHIT